MHLDGQAGDVPSGAPTVDEIDRPLHVSVFAPLRVEGLTDVGDGDVVVQDRDDLVPALDDVGPESIVGRTVQEVGHVLHGIRTAPDAVPG